MLENEIWKPITDYPGYEVSNYGRVKSLKCGKEKILKATISVGYFRVSLYKNGKSKIFNVHQLVAICFLGHNNCGHKLVVNHKDINRLNNQVDNLELITARENTNKKHIKTSSNYIGVSWHISRKKWQSRIRINGKLFWLGYFANEIEASNAYQNRLKEVI